MIVLYDLLLLLLILATLPWWLWRYHTTPKYRGTVAPRLGRLDPALVADLKDRPCFWIHAVSVGEALAAAGLVERLHALHPDHRVVVSTVTKTGRQVVLDKIPAVDHHIYLPLDLSPIVNRVVAALNPRFVVVMETELWPGLFHALGRRNIPLLVVNGRLSPTSFGGYHKARWFMRRFLRPVTRFAMQSAADGERMAAILGEDRRITITGNVKYDQALKLPTPAEMAPLRQRLGQPDGPLLLAASTHPGEEAPLLAAFATLRQRLPALRLILVPRHPERAAAVTALAREAGLSPRLFSESAGAWPEAVLVADQVGWLMRLYGLATVVFVGGSLIPHGGQNCLEPAAWGIPPLFGPHTFNFKEATRQLLEAQAALRIDDAGELVPALQQLLDDPAERTAMGQRARRTVAANQGALERTVQVIQDTLAERP